MNVCLQGPELLGRQPRAVNPAREAAAAAPLSNNKDNNKDSNDDDNDDDKSDLRSDLAPATLHFVWCGKRHFEFRHYMALKRADRLVKPDKVFFHFEYLPVIDSEGYYLWFNRTLADVDNVLLRPLMGNTNSSSGEDLGCAISGAQRFLLVLDLLEKFGGVYVPEDSILVDFPVHLRSSSLVSCYHFPIERKIHIVQADFCVNRYKNKSQFQSVPYHNTCNQIQIGYSHFTSTM